jgi:hypothetical protein
MAAVASSYPLISMCRLEDNVFYKIDREQVAQARFEDLGKQISDLQCHDPEILKRLNVVQGSSIVVLVPKDVEEGKSSKFDLITQVARKVLGNFKLDERSRAFVNNLLKPIFQQTNFQQEAVKFKLALDEEEVVPGEPVNEVLSSPSSNTKNVFVSFFKSDDPKNPFYFLINIDDLCPNDANELITALKAANLPVEQMTNDINENFIYVNVKGSEENNGCLFAIFTKLMSSMAFGDIHPLIGISEFESQIKALSKATKKHPEVADYQLLVNTIKEQLGGRPAKKPEMRDQATSPVKFPPGATAAATGSQRWVDFSHAKASKPAVVETSRKANSADTLLTITLDEDDIGFPAFLLHTLNLSQAERDGLKSTLQQQGLKVEDKKEYRKLFLAISLKKIESDSVSSKVRHNIYQVYAIIKKALKEPMRLCFSDFISNVEKAQKLASSDPKVAPELENIDLLIVQLKKEAASGEIRQLDKKAIETLQNAHILKPAKKAAKNASNPIVKAQAEPPSSILQPTLVKPKKSLPQKQSLISKIFKAIAFPFQWYWNGLKNLFKTLFGRK